MDESQEPVFLILGLLMFGGALIAALSQIIGKIKDKNQYSLLVQAKCIRLKKDEDEPKASLYCPVYETYINGQRHEISENVFSNDITVSVGDIKEMYVDPDNIDSCREAHKKISSDTIGSIVGVIIALCLGAAFVAVGIYGEELEEFRMTKEMAAGTMAIFFAIPGLALSLYVIKSRIEKKYRCTALVPATCVRIEQAIDDTKERPVYEIIYNNQKYELARDYYTRRVAVKVGDIRHIYINPQRPLDYYDPREKSAVFLLAIGLGFFACGLSGAIMILNS